MFHGAIKIIGHSFSFLFVFIEQNLCHYSKGSLFKRWTKFIKMKKYNGCMNVWTIKYLPLANNSLHWNLYQINLIWQQVYFEITKKRDADEKSDSCVLQFVVWWWWCPGRLLFQCVCQQPLCTQGGNLYLSSKCYLNWNERWKCTSWSSAIWFRWKEGLLGISSIYD